MIKRITFAALMLGTLATVPSVKAQTACGPRELLVTRLEGSFGEARMGAGLQGDTSMFEIWASSDSGSWTILVTNTDGISCVMAAGENWQDMPAMPAKQDAPA